MEEKALKDLHPMYREFCREDDEAREYDPDAEAEFKYGGYDVEDR